MENEELDFQHFVAHFDMPQVSALVLMGSFARGQAGPFSDVDLVRFTVADGATLPGNGTYFINGRFIVVSQVTPAQVEKGFTEPEIAVEVIEGLRNGRCLIDKNGTFKAIQERALNFQWDEALQVKANRWASRQMVGWIEEVHKGLEGLHRGDDVGRLLNARFGCSWGLTKVMCVQRGVLLTSDNNLFVQVTQAVGADSRWSQLCKQAFGIGAAYTLEDEVWAGLLLYVETAVALKNCLNPVDAPLILETVKHIKRYSS